MYEYSLLDPATPFSVMFFAIDSVLLSWSSSSVPFLELVCSMLSSLVSTNNDLAFGGKFKEQYAFIPFVGDKEIRWSSELE